MSNPEFDHDNNNEDFQDIAEGVPFVLYCTPSKTLVLDRRNTFLKRFSLGDGINDFCLHTFDGEGVVAFKGDPELHEKLLEIGVKSKVYDELDERDIEFLAEDFRDEANRKLS